MSGSVVKARRVTTDEAVLAAITSYRASTGPSPCVKVIVFAVQVPQSTVYDAVKRLVDRGRLPADWRVG